MIRFEPSSTQHRTHSRARLATALQVASCGLLVAVSACGDDAAGPPAGASSDSSGDVGTSSSTADPAETTAAETTAADTTAATTGPVEATLLERIVEALGGQASFDALASFELQVSGTRGWSDAGPVPGGPPAPASTFANTVTYELATASLRVDVERTVVFDGVSVPQTFRELVQGTLGHIDGTESLFGIGTGDLPSDRWAEITREQRLLNPHIILAEVVADPSLATELGAEDYDGRPHERLEIQDAVAPIVLWVDSETDFVSRLTTMENDPLRRDVVVEVIYSDWSSDTEVRFPAAVELRVAGAVVHAEQRESIAVNVGLAPDTFAFPAGAAPLFVEEDAARGALRHQWHRGFASIGIPMSGVQTAIEAAELAPGVHHLTGGSHHSLVVEQADGVVVVDAPLYEARCLAILDWIDANLAGASTTHIVVSHFHQDHSACARTFIARGATLVVGEAAQDAWDAILAAPSTLEPDEFAKNPVADPDIVLVPDGGSLTLDDASNPLTLYHLESEHAHDLLLPFVDSAGVAYTVDLFSPNLSLPADAPQEVLDALALHGITDDVTTVVGGHGMGTATVADIEAAAAGG